MSDLAVTQFKHCWSCGTEETLCKDGCRCQKCIDPVKYDEWKYSEDYAKWKRRMGTSYRLYWESYKLDRWF